MAILYFFGIKHIILYKELDIQIKRGFIHSKKMFNEYSNKNSWFLAKSLQKSCSSSSMAIHSIHDNMANHILKQLPLPNSFKYTIFNSITLSCSFRVLTLGKCTHKSNLGIRDALWTLLIPDKASVTLEIAHYRKIICPEMKCK